MHDRDAPGVSGSTVADAVLPKMPEYTITIHTHLAGTGGQWSLRIVDGTGIVRCNLVGPPRTVEVVLQQWNRQLEAEIAELIVDVGERLV